MIKLLLVDDHQIVRAGLIRLLENQQNINIVGDVGSGEAAYQFIREKEVDVIVMDLSMPGKGGIESTRQIKKHYSKINILILSMHDNSTMAKKVMDAGATGYILKNDIADDLINAIYSVSHSEVVFSKSIKTSLVNQSNNILSKLNNKELEIFKSLAKSKDLKSIAMNLNISYKTAANYQTSIKQKLKLKTSIDLYQIAKDNGFVE
jgi:DNA-binding NarL/FixJ family response regulator